MPPARNQTEGCWTCRIRRKRCDAIRPNCGACQSLQIYCYFDSQKPTWMDGASEQKEMMQKIKTEIQQNAARRRERRALGVYDQGMEMNMVVTTERDYRDSSGPSSDSQLAFPSPAPISAIIESESSPASDDVRIVGDDEMELEVAPISSLGQTTPGILNHPFTFSVSSSDSHVSRLNLGKDIELGFIMIYLDHVFPFMFPFYRPSLLETGRHWVLSLLCRNETSFYTAASLASYFYSVVLQDARQETQDNCKALVWEQLMGQMDRAVETIQHDIVVITRLGIQNALMESAQVLGEITQLLTMEVTVRRNDWTIHLNPAYVLFEDIFKYHGTLSFQPNLDLLLSRMSPMATEHNKPAPNIANQSSMLFFIAMLIFVDIISSTALDRSPRLCNYHESLLTNSQRSKVSISLQRFVGCQNWVLISISAICDLNAWKKNGKQKGTLSVMDLVSRARPIAKTLQEGIMDLDANIANNNSPATAIVRLESYYTAVGNAKNESAIIAKASRIWAYAAKLYLSVVLSGWQLINADVQADVTSLLELLKVVDSPAQLRSFAWPLCITGCLALPYQQQTVRNIIQSMGKLAVFGAVNEAKNIIEAVWRSRESLNRDTWDISSCLTILGSPSLLV
jgi:hypothetical protein